MEKNYIQDVNEDSIDLTKSITIYGNNHSIDSKNNDSSMFRVYSNTSLVFENLNFKNSNLFSSNRNVSNVSIMLVNCTFPVPEIVSCEVYAFGYDWGLGISCEIDPEIKLLAFSIIGDSTDLDAARKLTNWVGKNIAYEKDDGFYQSPIETLNRRLGNCCCQTDLLLQMMDAVGLTKNHEIYYIHVGTNKFGQRHFFAMIDSFCIDPTLGTPWGHGGFGNRPAIITKYPVMPLPYGHYGRV